MLIYCNGDSFVQGVELGDTIIPEHPTFKHFTDNLDEAKKWLAKTYDHNHDYGKIRELNSTQIIKLEYERAFPHKLGKLLNVPVINHGMGGSSLDRIVRTTITDLISLKKDHDNIIAIIGDTHYSRSELANFEYIDSLDIAGFNRYWVCLSTTYHMSGREPLEPILDYKIRYEKNYHMLVNYYKNIIMLQDFCKSNDITLHWVSCHDDISRNSKPEPEYENDICLNNFIEYADLDFIVRMEEVAERLHYDVYCPGGHFSEKVHEEVASIIANIIKEKYDV